MNLNDVNLLPGGDLVLKGLVNLEAGELSKESLLLVICRSELERVGLQIHPKVDVPSDAELHLYELLQRDSQHEAHALYNALLAQMVSFLSCAEARS